MSETIQSAAPLASPSIEHLSVRADGLVPMGPTFMVGRNSGRLPLAFAASFAFDAAFVLVLVLLTRMGVNLATSPAVLPEDPNKHIVWLSQPGPGGGGGGGGNKMKEPPRVAELKGKDKITVPVEKPPALEIPKPTPPPKRRSCSRSTFPRRCSRQPTMCSRVRLNRRPPVRRPCRRDRDLAAAPAPAPGPALVPVRALVSDLVTAVEPAAASISRETASRLPRLIRDVKPKYTSDAMRAKIQGTVLMQCVVRPDGSVTDIQVVRSLDPMFGLDQEAINAARQWKFQPGTRMGQPVAVQITIELQFTLR